MNNISIFDLMQQGKDEKVTESKKATVEKPSVTETKAKAPQQKEEKVTESKKPNVAEIKTKETKKKETKKEPTSDEKTEAKLKEFTEIEIKVFGTTVMNITEDSEIENIKLLNIRDRLIEMGYQELRQKVSWLIVPDSDNIKCILTVIPAFQNKG